MSKPFKQVPVFTDDAKVAIPIEDFIELQDFLKFFAEPFTIMQKAYHSAINSGVISFKYLEDDDTEITEDEARKRIEEYNKKAL